MSEVVLVTALSAHLIAVNLAGAGPLYCVAIEWQATRRGDAVSMVAARRLAMVSLLAFLAGASIGGGLLAYLWNHDASYGWALARVPPYRWWFFAAETVFSFVCMIVYLALWRRVERLRWLHRSVAVLAAANLLYHFPPLFTMLSLMNTRHEFSDAVLDRSLYVRLFTDSETLARVAHHWLSALATAGVAVMILASRRRTPTDAESPASPAARFGACGALTATLLQFPVGIWLLLSSPRAAQSQLLGGDLIASLVLGAAIVATVVLVPLLFGAAFGDDARATALKVAILLVAIILLMTKVLHKTQHAERIAATSALESIQNVASPNPIRRARMVNKISDSKHQISTGLPVGSVAFSGATAGNRT